MFSNKFTLKVITTFVVVFSLASCSDDQAITQVIEPPKVMPQKVVLDVYKSPSCGCCKKWISHINDNGFASKVHSFDDFPAIKDEKGIEPRYRSCHTAISNEGYVFEGHVPAKFIHQFMQETHKDDVIGLSVPAMPVGTPGMEVENKFQPYKVLLLKQNGSYETYANVQSYEEQF
ncbi:DUF411 domain-containing protein [Colwellia sp. BRX10-3]|uniref:DUF411 domain-containing protein n=1 Tax=Colwellia sp. BRX10-3 TaxID=2759844 RepID=UPI0015F3BBBE|nr:DUF411 domain-containing protein [Colwellia sp. BRX10-3]MBA6391285.1 DUF411 domain-containing protein [Colwellia sp. BRX10-3]